MKKQELLLLVGVIFLAGLLGCPSAPVVPTPVPGDEVDSTMAEVVVSGRLYDPEAKATTHEIGDMLKQHVVQLNFFFCQGEGESYQEKFFLIPVEDGAYAGKFVVNPGSYQIVVSASDANGRIIFYDNFSQEIVAGKNRLEVSLAIKEKYTFLFVVEGLPGEYEEYGTGEITTKDGLIFWASYGPENINGDDAPAIMAFRAYLPMNFDGVESQAVLVVKDKNGDSYVTELGFSIFEAIDGTLVVPYVFPDWLGQVEVGILFEFEYENFRPTDEQGRVLPALLIKTVDDNNISVTMDTGDFPVFYYGVFYPEGYEGGYLSDCIFKINYKYVLTSGETHVISRPKEITCQWYQQEPFPAGDCFRPSFPAFLDGKLLKLAVSPEGPIYGYYYWPIPEVLAE